MNQSHKGRRGISLRWILGGGIVLIIVIGVALAAFLPVWVVQWLGGKDFQKLASQQVSSLLQTEGDFESLEWSSFSVYTPGFKSRPGAPGPWLWDFQDIRTEISPRLLLDRILRFSEITIGRLAIQSGSKIYQPREVSPTPTSREGSTSELFRDVQVGKVEIRDFQITPSPNTSGWGAKGITVQIKPSKQKTDFTFQQGFIQTPLNWLGDLSLVEAKGRYVEPTLFLTELSLKGKSGGSMDMSGEITPGTTPQAKGRVSWEKWPIPGGKIGVGLFEIPASMSGEFVLQ